MGSLGVLFVDDEPHNLELFRLLFEGTHRVLTAPGGREALAILEREDVGVLLTDERMPGMSGVELLAHAHDRWPETVRVIVSAYSDAERLLRAINLGHAQEYLVKPWDPEELARCVERSLTMASRRRALVVAAERGRVAEEDAHRAHDPGEIVGAGLSATVAAVKRAARSDSTVLLRGETGTGKELLARLLHAESTRAAGPFVRVACAALGEGVLESELFGHERGAFTGALRARRGRFELAQGGTIFLDEIGDVSPKLQVSLLRVLQEREIERVGGEVTIPVDVRVVAATHRDLAAMVEAGTFREDLFYRLDVLRVTVPPLRERAADVPDLLRHLLAKHAPGGRAPRVEPEALAALSRYGWPGNVRELENVAQRALVMGDRELLTLEDFCLDLRAAAPPAPPPPEGATGHGTARDEAREREAQELRELLIRSGGNCARAARELGVPRTTFLARARRHGLL